MNEATSDEVNSPRWIVADDGRVEQFDPSQLAADLYRARCTHQRKGAALFAAELSAAVMHFAQREFVSHVWRADRLRRTTARVLRELGDAETAAAWLRMGEAQVGRRPLRSFSPDLIELVQDGVLEFDLRVEGSRTSLGIVDAIDHVGAARSAQEFLHNLHRVLVEATSTAERVLLRNASLCTALIHDAGDDPERAAALFVEVVAKTIETTLTPFAIDLRIGDESRAESRLSGGPLFPFVPSSDWKTFHRSFVDRVPKLVAKLEQSRLPLCVLVSTSPEDPVENWLAEWKSSGAERAATLLIGAMRSPFESPRSVEITFRLSSPLQPTKLTARNLGILAAVPRAAFQRIAALQRQESSDSIQKMEVVACLAGQHPEWFIDECRKRLREFARPYGISVRLAAPCRVWWGDDGGKFSSEFKVGPAQEPNSWSAPFNHLIDGLIQVPRLDAR